MLSYTHIEVILWSMWNICNLGTSATIKREKRIKQKEKGRARLTFR